MIRAFALLALLAGCSAPRPDCETACGAEMAGGNCKELARAEYLAISTFNEGPYQGRAHEMCRALDSVQIQFAPGQRVWALNNGNEISIKDERYLAYYLAHEFAHIWQRELEGQSGGECGTSDLPCHLETAVQATRANLGLCQ